MKIVLMIDPYKYHFSINLTKDGLVFGKKGFKNPVKALAYVGQLQQQGHQGPNEPNGSKLVELARLWEVNS